MVNQPDEHHTINFNLVINIEAPDFVLTYRLYNPDVGIHDPDYRHLIKRIRNRFLIIELHYLYHSQFNHAFLVCIIQLSGLHVNKDILDPSDKQNVNAARFLFKTLIEVQSWLI